MFLNMVLKQKLFMKVYLDICMPTAENLLACDFFNGFLAFASMCVKKGMSIEK